MNFSVVLLCICSCDMPLFTTVCDEPDQQSRCPTAVRAHRFFQVVLQPEPKVKRKCCLDFDIPKITLASFRFRSKNQIWEEEAPSVWRVRVTPRALLEKPTSLFGSFVPVV